MGVCISVFGLAVACLAFGAATRDSAKTAGAAPGAEKMIKTAVKPPRFFVPRPMLPVAARTSIPIEALLLEIENHVRLEQAAAECFLESPNASRLHSRTMSTLVN